MVRADDGQSGRYSDNPLLSEAARIKRARMSSDRVKPARTSVFKTSTCCAAVRLFMKFHDFAFPCSGRVEAIQWGLRGVANCGSINFRWDRAVAGA